SSLLFLSTRRPPQSTLFPYTTLFRSSSTTGRGAVSTTTDPTATSGEVRGPVAIAASSAAPSAAAAAAQPARLPATPLAVLTGPVSTPRVAAARRPFGEDGGPAAACGRRPRTAVCGQPGQRRAGSPDSGPAARG